MSGVVKTIKKVVKGIVKAVVGVVKAVVNVVSSVVSFITQPFMGLFGGMPDMPDAGAEAERQQGVLITRNGSTVNIPVVYGLRRVGGAITFAETGAQDNRYLWVAYALSEGTVEGLFDLFIDDNQLASKYIPLLNNGQTVTVDEGKFKDRIVMRFSHGRYFADPTTNNTVGGDWNPCSDAPSWKSSMVYNGVATLFVRYEWKKIETQEQADANPFSGSIPAIKTTLLGRKVASISSSSGSTAYDSETELYSTNPAEVLLDYLRNPRYGKGLKNTDIDFDSFLVAKNKYNTNVTYTTGTATGPIITTNTVLDTQQSLFANVKMLLMGCRSYLPYSQGKYKLKVEDAGNATDITSGVATIVQTFNSDNIQGAVTYQAIERSAKYNVVEINYVNPDKAYSVESVIYPETLAERQTYIDKDGGRENKLTATFPTITNYAIAKDMARLLFNKSRFQESVSFTASSQALELEVGDNIRIQSTMLNFSTTPFRVISMKINNDMTVDLGCVRNDDSLYPHTRVGEEDIVLPPYIPKGGRIFYPEIVGGQPIGLVPPGSSPVPIVHRPPQIFSTSPTTVSGAGTHDITISGNRLFTGLTAVFIGDDGTEITPGVTTRISDNSVVIQTISGMTDANQPYDIKITNNADNGSLSVRQNNVLTIDAVEPVPEDPVEDPVIPEDPVDPGPTPPSTPDPEPPVAPEPPEIVFDLNEFVTFSKIRFESEGNLVYANITGLMIKNPDFKELIIYYKRTTATARYQRHVEATNPGAEQEYEFRLGPLLPNATYRLDTRVKYANGELSSATNTINIATSAGDVVDIQDYPSTTASGWPGDQPPVTPIRNSTFNSIVGQTLLTTSAPRTPKAIQFTVKQEILNEPANFDVIGVRYYIKASSATEWTRYTATFDQSYIPGSAATFEIASGAVGNPAHPSTPTSAQQNYDFVFRFLHSDGTESTQQIRYASVKTEYNSIASPNQYDFNPLFGGPNPVKESSNSFVMPIVDPNAPSAASSMTVNLTSIEAPLSSKDGEIRFFFNPPDASVQSSWLGMNIRYRKIVPGTDPDFTLISSTRTQITDGSAREFFNIEYDKTYEFVITPVYNNSGTRADSTQSIFCVGYVHNFQNRPDFPPTQNWLPSFSPIQMTTERALKQIDEAFPAPPNPLVAIEEWKLLQNPNGPWYNNGLKGYYKLTFNHHAVTDFTQLNVYRRRNNTQSSDPIDSKGRWEKIIINTVSSTPGSTTVYLRPPLDNGEFNSYFTPTNGQSLFVPYQIGSGYYVDATHGFTSGSGTRPGDEFLLIVEGSSGEETVGMFLHGAQNINSGTQDLLLGNRPIERNKADFNGFDTGYQRNISQAITAIANVNCLAGVRGKKWSDYLPSVSPTLE